MIRMIVALVLSAFVVFAADAAKPAAEPVAVVKPTLTLEQKVAAAKLQNKVMEATAIKEIADRNNAIAQRDVAIAERDKTRADERATSVRNEWKAWEAEALKGAKSPDGCQINTDLDVQCPPTVATKPEVKK